MSERIEMISSVRIISAITVVLAAHAAAPAQMPDNLTSVVSSSHVKGSTSGALGCFRQNPNDGKIYIGVFGAARALRVYDPATDTSDEFVDADTISGFELASDVLGGVTAAGTGVSGGVGIVSGMAFNPAPIELSWHNPQTGLDEPVVYPPGTLAYIIDGSTDVKYSGVTRPDYTKKLWRWDLRKAWTPTSAVPDYANAVNGNGVLVGAYGQADWNDIFSVVITEEDLHAVSGSTATENLARQFAWSSDGASIYFVDRLAGTSQGGIWKVNATTGALQRIWRASPASAINPIAEPATLPTSAHDFTNGESTGEQVFFDGLVGDGTNDGAGNLGGISYLVDTGDTIAGPFKLFGLDDFKRYAEWNGYYHQRLLDEQGNDPGINPAPEARAYSILVDTDGTVFFYDSDGGQNIWRYDLQGRFVGVKSKDQHILHNLALGSTSTSGVSMRLQLRSVDFDNGTGVFSVPQLLFMSTATATVSGVYVFAPGDFDRDNDLDTNDVSLFMAALATPINTFNGLSGSKPTAYEAAATPFGQELRVADPAALAEYLKFDLNCNGLVNGKDKLILWRFRGLAPCDYDADGDVDAGDRAQIEAALGQNTTYTVLVRPVGDLNRDAAINLDDLGLFTPCFTGPAITYAAGLPEACTLKMDDEGFVDADLDHDFDVDQADFGRLQGLLATTPELLVRNVLFGDGDLDNDDDVDQDDLTIFDGCFSGEGVPADPHCAD